MGVVGDADHVLLVDLDGGERDLESAERRFYGLRGAPWRPQTGLQLLREASSFPERDHAP